MAALWLSNVLVTNEDEYAKYAKLAGPAITKHGGRFLARGARAVQIEGKEFPRNVVVTFDSIEAAQACYNSPEYQAILPIRLANSTGVMTIVDGYAP